MKLVSFFKYCYLFSLVIFLSSCWVIFQSEEDVYILIDDGYLAQNGNGIILTVNDYIPDKNIRRALSVKDNSISSIYTSEDDIEILLSSNINPEDRTYIYVEVDTDIDLGQHTVQKGMDIGPPTETVNRNYYFHDDQKSKLKIYNDFYIICPEYNIENYYIYFQYIDTINSNIISNDTTRVSFKHKEEYINADVFIRIYSHETEETRFLTSTGELFSDQNVYSGTIQFYPGNILDMSHLDLLTLLKF